MKYHNLLSRIAFFFLFKTDILIAGKHEEKLNPSTQQVEMLNGNNTYKITSQILR